MDPDLIVPNPNLSLSQGAIAPWNTGRSSFYSQTINSLCQFLDISPSTKWKDIPEEARKIIMYGSGNVCVPMYYSRFVTDKPFEGVVPNMERRFWKRIPHGYAKSFPNTSQRHPANFAAANV